MHKPPRRVDDPPEINMKPVREEERDIWARIGVFVDHYKLAWAFWLIAATTAGWIGKHIMDPLEAVPLQAEEIRQMRASIDTVKVQLVQASEDRKDIVQMLRVFGKVICLNVLNNDDRYKYDVDCSNLPTPTPKPTTSKKE